MLGYILLLPELPPPPLQMTEIREWICFETTRSSRSRSYTVAINVRLGCDSIFCFHVVETKLCDQVHIGRPYQSDFLCKIQPLWRMACYVM